MRDSYHQLVWIGGIMAALWVLVVGVQWVGLALGDMPASTHEDCRAHHHGWARTACGLHVRLLYRGADRFLGYDCPRGDCSLHRAGADWAATAKLDHWTQCVSQSRPAQQGCWAYIECEHQPQRSEEEEEALPKGFIAADDMRTCWTDARLYDDADWSDEPFTP